jgi:hypothetical protein
MMWANGPSPLPSSTTSSLAHYQSSTSLLLPGTRSSMHVVDHQQQPKMLPQIPSLRNNPYYKPLPASISAPKSPLPPLHPANNQRLMMMSSGTTNFYSGGSNRSNVSAGSASSLALQQPKTIYYQ